MSLRAKKATAAKRKGSSSPRGKNSSLTANLAKRAGISTRSPERSVAPDSPPSRMEAAPVQRAGTRASVQREPLPKLSLLAKQQSDRETLVLFEEHEVNQMLESAVVQATIEFASQLLSQKRRARTAGEANLKRIAEDLFEEVTLQLAYDEALKCKWSKTTPMDWQRSHTGGAGLAEAKFSRFLKRRKAEPVADSEEPPPAPAVAAKAKSPRAKKKSRRRRSPDSASSPSSSASPGGKKTARKKRVRNVESPGRGRNAGAVVTATSESSSDGSPSSKKEAAAARKRGSPSPRGRRASLNAHLAKRAARATAKAAKIVVAAGGQTFAEARLARERDPDTFEASPSSSAAAAKRVRVARQQELIRRHKLLYHHRQANQKAPAHEVVRDAMDILEGLKYYLHQDSDWMSQVDRNKVRRIDTFLRGCVEYIDGSEPFLLEKLYELAKADYRMRRAHANAQAAKMPLPSREAAPDENGREEGAGESRAVAGGGVPPITAAEIKNSARPDLLAVARRWRTSREYGETSRRTSSASHANNSAQHKFLPNGFRTRNRRVSEGTKMYDLPIVDELMEGTRKEGPRIKILRLPPNTSDALPDAAFLKKDYEVEEEQAIARAEVEARGAVLLNPEGAQLVDWSFESRTHARNTRKEPGLELEHVEDSGEKGNTEGAAAEKGRDQAQAAALAAASARGAESQAAQQRGHSEQPNEEANSVPGGGKGEGAKAGVGAPRQASAYSDVGAYLEAKTGNPATFDQAPRQASAYSDVGAYLEAKTGNPATVDQAPRQASVYPDVATYVEAKSVRNPGGGPEGEAAAAKSPPEVTSGKEAAPQPQNREDGLATAGDAPQHTKRVTAVHKSSSAGSGSHQHVKLKRHHSDFAEVRHACGKPIVLPGDSHLVGRRFWLYKHLLIPQAPSPESEHHDHDYHVGATRNSKLRFYVRDGCGLGFDGDAQDFKLTRTTAQKGEKDAQIAYITRKDRHHPATKRLSEKQLADRRAARVQQIRNKRDELAVAEVREKERLEQLRLQKIAEAVERKLQARLQNENRIAMLRNGELEKTKADDVSDRELAEIDAVSEKDAQDASLTHGLSARERRIKEKVDAYVDQRAWEKANYPDGNVRRFCERHWDWFMKKAFEGRIRLEEEDEADAEPSTSAAAASSVQSRKAELLEGIHAGHKHLRRLLHKDAKHFDARAGGLQRTVHAMRRQRNGLAALQDAFGLLEGSGGGPCRLLQLMDNDATFGYARTVCPVPPTSSEVHAIEKHTAEEEGDGKLAASSPGEDGEVERTPGQERGDMKLFLQAFGDDVESVEGLSDAGDGVERGGGQGAAADGVDESDGFDVPDERGQHGSKSSSAASSSASSARNASASTTADEKAGIKKARAAATSDLNYVLRCLSLPQPAAQMVMEQKVADRAAKTITPHTDVARLMRQSTRLKMKEDESPTISQHRSKPSGTSKHRKKGSKAQQIFGRLKSGLQSELRALSTAAWAHFCAGDLECSVDLVDKKDLWKESVYQAFRDGLEANRKIYAAHGQDPKQSPLEQRAAHLRANDLARLLRGFDSWRNLRGRKEQRKAELHAMELERKRIQHLRTYATDYRASGGRSNFSSKSVATVIGESERVDAGRLDFSGARTHMITSDGYEAAAQEEVDREELVHLGGSESGGSIDHELLAALGGDSDNTHTGGTSSTSSEAAPSAAAQQVLSEHLKGIGVAKRSYLDLLVFYKERAAREQAEEALLRDQQFELKRLREHLAQVTVRAEEDLREYNRKIAELRAERKEVERKQARANTVIRGQRMGALEDAKDFEYRLAPEVGVVDVRPRERVLADYALFDTIA